MQERAASKWLKVCLLFLFWGLSPGLNGCGSNSNLPSFSVNGTSWFFYHTVNGTAGVVESDPFSFSQSSGSNNITGTTPQSEALSGTIDGNNISIIYPWTVTNGTVYTYTYTGSFNSDGTVMTGTWSSTNPSDPAGIWNGVVNLAPQVNITGNWNLSYTTNGTSGQQGPDLFTFNYFANATGNNITGTGPQEQDIVGRTGVFSVFFSWVGSDGTTTFMYSGMVDISGTTMSGTWTDTSGQSGTWSATKNS